MPGSARSACRALAAAFFLILFSATTGVAQAPGEASGALNVIVSDTTGARIAGAAIALTRGAERRVAVTGSDGAARVAALAPGAWNLVVSREGFEPWQREVTVGAATPDVAATLLVAGLAETVRVESTLRPVTSAPLDSLASGGTRLDLPVRDLPVSLFLISQELIQERGARSAEEAVQLTVGMTASTGVGSIPSYSTRGWGGNNISVMRDGIRQNSSSQSSRPVDTFVLDRVEVLKGPASLLYGEGAIGGAVNMVSKSPAPAFGVDTLLSYGSFDSYRLGIGLNVPLRRNLSARVDLSQNSTGGFTDDSPQRLRAVAASLRWAPTSNMSLKASGTYSDDDVSAYYATPFIDGAIDPRTRRLNYNMQDRLTKSHNRWAQIEGNVLLAGGWTVRNQLFATTHELDWRNFESYAYNPATGMVDVSALFLIWRDDLLVGNRTDVRNEARVFGRTVRFTAGAEVQRNDMERAGTPAGTNIRFSVDPFNPEPISDPGLQYQRQRDVLITTRALFAESVVEATSRVKVIGGLRWEQIALDYTPYPSQVTASTEYRPTTGRLGIVVEATSRTNVYASYSAAVEPTTQLVSLDGSQQQFSLVPGRQFEVGAKGGAFNGRLEGTVAYFAIAKRDILTRSLIDGVLTNQQVGRQTSNGVELALAGRPIRSLTIAGDVALTGADFADFNEIVNNANVSRTGNTPPNVPAVIWNLTPTQRIGRLDLSATLRQVGTRWGDNANTRRVGSYTTFDAAMSYRLPSGTRLTLRGRNLADRVYTHSVNPTAGRLEPPRSFDVTITTGF